VHIIHLRNSSYLHKAFRRMRAPGATVYECIDRGKKLCGVWFFAISLIPLYNTYITFRGFSSSLFLLGRQTYAVLKTRFLWLVLRFCKHQFFFPPVIR
jgi:hypothetical protein